MLRSASQLRHSFFLGHKKAEPLGFGTWSRSLRRLRLRRVRVTLLVLDALLALREVSEDGGQTCQQKWAKIWPDMVMKCNE